MPKVYDALKVQNTAITLEVQQQLGDGVVRCIALGSTDGLKRNLVADNTGKAVSVPVGAGTLGRIMNVLGDRSTRPVRSTPPSTGKSTAKRRATKTRRRPTSCWKPASRSST